MEMEKIAELGGYINKALEMEHSAAIQYAAHAESVQGLYSESVIARLKDSQHDEEKHADVLRNLLGDYLKVMPVMTMTEAKPATGISAILTVNMASEKEAIAQYQLILEFIAYNKVDFAPIYAKVEHDIRHILMEEQEHVAELERLAA